MPQGTEAEWCCESVSWWNERIRPEERMLNLAVKNMKLRPLRPNERVNRASRERKIGWNRRFGGSECEEPAACGWVRLNGGLGVA